MGRGFFQPLPCLHDANIRHSWVIRLISHMRSQSRRWQLWHCTKNTQECSRATRETKSGYSRLVTKANWLSKFYPLPRRLASSAKPVGNFPAHLEASTNPLETWRDRLPRTGQASSAWRSVVATFPVHTLSSKAARLKNKRLSSSSRGRKWNEVTKRREECLSFNTAYRGQPCCHRANAAPNKSLPPNFFPLTILSFPYFWNLWLAL